MTCKSCSNPFPISEKELALLEKLSGDIVRQCDGESRYAFPAPSLCPDCRQQRRLAFRNERQLYPDTCDLCATRILSLYSPDKNYPVYCSRCYWQDGWSAFQYAQDFDPGRSFLSQLKALWQRVPRLALTILGENENSDFTNDNYKLKNCYLVFDGEQSVDCSYGETFTHLKNCVDFLSLQHSELCYECINCVNCYELRFSQGCHNCHASSFLVDCIGCKNCFGCCNLSQKQFCIFNEEYSPADYAAKLRRWDLTSYSGIEAAKAEVEQFVASQPKRSLRGVRNEDVTGDNLDNSKDCFACFDCTDCRDCGYSTGLLMGATDCLDHNMWGENTTLVYNSAAVGASSQNVFCSFYVYQNVDSAYYSAFCSRGVRNIFGCVGLRRAENCILNKQYSSTEYRGLLRKIVDELIEEKHWGEFFPIDFSDFGYNETVAQEHFPLSRGEATRLGYRWSSFENPLPSSAVIDAADLPDDIAAVTDAVLSSTIRCTESNRCYRLISSELDFYRRYSLPLPRLHPDLRHLNRLAKRPPRNLWSRDCSSCGKHLETNYSPHRQESILCPDCYRLQFRA